MNVLLLIAWLMTLSHSDSNMKFVGSTPCDAIVRQFVGIAATAECERISWQLALPASGDGAFTLDAVYGMQANSAPGFAGGGTPAQMRGTVKSTTRQRRTYRLLVDNRSLEFAQLDPNLIHVLDVNDRLMIGNPGWSYTLSRTPAAQRALVAQSTGRAARFPVGVYEGRTPCEALENDLGRKRNPECTKAKWRLTFEDTRYVLEGFGYRNPPRTGTWRALQDPRELGAVVLQLDPDQRQRFLSFRVVYEKLLLFLDKNGRPLVGDEYQSYTLNKVR